MSIQTQLNELVDVKKLIVSNLTSKNVSATDDNTLRELAEKILEIEGGGSTGNTITIYDSQRNVDAYGTTVYIKDTSNNAETLANFVLENPDFCSEKNEYALNYSSSIFGWSSSIATCSTVPIAITKASQILMTYKSGSAQSGVFRLVKSDSNTALSILTNAEIEGKYIDIPLTWVYNTDYITVALSCTDAESGTYYMYWVGVSDNSHPLIKNVTVLN